MLLTSKPHKMLRPSITRNLWPRSIRILLLTSLNFSCCYFKEIIPKIKDKLLTPNCNLSSILASIKIKMAISSSFCHQWHKIWATYLILDVITIYNSCRTTILCKEPKDRTNRTINSYFKEQATWILNSRFRMLKLDKWEVNFKILHTKIWTLIFLTTNHICHHITSEIYELTLRLQTVEWHVFKMYNKIYIFSSCYHY